MMNISHQEVESIYQIVSGDGRRKSSWKQWKRI